MNDKVAGALGVIAIVGVLALSAVGATLWAWVVLAAALGLGWRLFA